MSHPAVELRDEQPHLRVRVVPGASRDRIIGLHGPALRVSVSAPPEKGQANRAVCRLIARTLDLRPASVTLTAGETSRDKTLKIEGLSATELESRLPS